MYKKYKFSVECLCNGEKEKMSFFYNLDYFYEIQVTSYNVVDSTEKLILQRKNNSQVMWILTESHISCKDFDQPASILFDQRHSYLQ